MNKTCNKCGETKPATAAYFHRMYAGRDDVFVNTCIACRTLYCKDYYSKNRVKSILKSSRVFDEARGLKFDLDVEWFEENVLGKPCHYCGIAENRMGVDRLDNELGHTKDNCVPCCSTCNRVRLDIFSPEEMKELGAVIYKIKKRRAESEDHSVGPVSTGPFGHRQ